MKFCYETGMEEAGCLSSLQSSDERKQMRLKGRFVSGEKISGTGEKARACGLA